MIVVSNTTPIISLSSIGHLTLLSEIFGKITIPNAVYNEIKAKKSYAYEEIDSGIFDVKPIKGTEYLGFLLVTIQLF